MSVLLTVSIAIAAFLVCCLIGLYFMKPKKPKKPIKDVIKMPVVLSTAVLDNVLQMTCPELEYNNRVDAVFKEVVEKVVDMWNVKADWRTKTQIVDMLYAEFRGKLDNVDYSKYNPDFPCLTIAGGYSIDGFMFKSFWSKKTLISN